MSTSILEKKDRTMNQLAGDIRRSLKAQGIEYMEDHKGEKVPIKYVPAIDLLRHGYCEEILQRAKEVDEEIAELKYYCQSIGNRMYELLMEEEEIRNNSKGGFRMGLFDKSAYIDFKMDTVEDVDKAMLSKAEAHKNKFVDDVKDELGGDISEEYIFIFDLMNDAFETTTGRLDPRIRTKLNKYSSRIPNKHFQNFLDCYNQAFDLRHTKRYEKFVEKDEQNEEQSILLNYRNVEPQAPDTDA